MGQRIHLHVDWQVSIQSKVGFLCANVHVAHPEILSLK